MEAVQQIMGYLNCETVEEAMALLTPELRRAMRDHLGQLPTTDDGWTNLKQYWIGGCPPPGDFVHEVPIEERNALRLKVERLREYFGRPEARRSS
jgi:hypothetical protein